MKHILFLLSVSICLATKIIADAPPLPPSPSQSQEESMLNETLRFAKGHNEFKNLYFKQHEDDFVRLVKDGQNPQTLFISCSDSRVVPDLILSSRPGDLFVIRNAGNFVPPINYSASDSPDGAVATIQYATEVLNVKHIIVCGHSHCGAIRGLFKQLDPQLGFLKNWLRLGEEAKRIAEMSRPAHQVDSPFGSFKEDIYSVTEKISVIYQLEHLMSYPFIKKRVNEGSLELHGWYFKIESGELFYYNVEQYQFIPLTKKLIEQKISSRSIAQ